LLFSLVGVGIALLGFWLIALLVFFGSLVAAGRGWSRWRLYKNWLQRLAWIIQQ